MSLSKPASAFTAGLLIASLAAYLGASAAATERNDHKPAVVTHRNHQAYRLYNSGDRRLIWSQMPPCHNKYITGVPCITSTISAAGNAMTTTPSSTVAMFGGRSHWGSSNASGTKLTSLDVCYWSAYGA
jgi:hypothetical protein